MGGKRPISKRYRFPLFDADGLKPGETVKVLVEESDEHDFWEFSLQAPARATPTLPSLASQAAASFCKGHFPTAHHHGNDLWIAIVGATLVTKIVVLVGRSCIEPMAVFAKGFI